MKPSGEHQPVKHGQNHSSQEISRGRGGGSNAAAEAQDRLGLQEEVHTDKDS